MLTDPATLPDQCGVYLFRASSGKVLYVGKAINIRARVRSHLQDRKNDREIKLREASDSIDWIATGSELEALILEDTLIKRYKPRFNIRLKDDKSYPYLLITDDEYPSILQVRGLEQGKGEYFGPHSDPRAVRRSLRWLRKIFPVRSCRRDMSRPSRPCLEHHLGRCLAPCTGRVNAGDYIEMVDGLRKFLSGKREELVSRLEKDMWKYSSSEDYEKAALIRDIVQGLQRIRQAQKVVLVKGGDLDAVHLSDDGELATVVKVRDGRVVDVVSFTLEGDEPLSDPHLDFISSFYAISGFIPDVIVTGKRGLDPDKREELERFLSKKKGRKVRIIWGRGEEKGSLIRMAQRNSRLYRMEREKSLEKEEVLLIMKDRLHLERIPRHIEGFDISHLGGKGTVASMVMFKDARPKRSGYRRFRIRSAANDDYLSMKEAVSRRYRGVLDRGDDLPDMILIDGGKGQLNAALEALKDQGIERLPDIVSLAKKEEELFRPGSPDPVVLKRTDPSLKLLQRIRDESHRFALSYQRKLREKDMTILTEVPGIGNERAKKLLRSFPSLEEMVRTGAPGISERCSIPILVSDELVRFLKEHLAK